MKQKYLFFWNSLAFPLIQQMLATWSLVPLPFLNPVCASGSSPFMKCWSLVWRILRITLLVCEMSMVFELSLVLPLVWKKKKKKFQKVAIHPQKRAALHHLITCKNEAKPHISAPAPSGSLKLLILIILLIIFTFGIQIILSLLPSQGHIFYFY